MESSSGPISISAVIDVVGALATGTLTGSIYMLDTNRANGSSGTGTESLKTVVKKGDQLIWTILPLECEAYAAIDNVTIDKEVCEPVEATYPGTDISFWSGTVKKDAASTPYTLDLKVGTRVAPMSTPKASYLVSTPAAPAARAALTSKKGI